MKNRKKIIITAIIILFGALLYVYVNKDNDETTVEDEKVDQMVKTDQERSDSMKRALGID